MDYSSETTKKSYCDGRKNPSNLFLVVLQLNIMIACKVFAASEETVVLITVLIR